MDCLTKHLSFSPSSSFVPQRHHRRTSVYHSTTMRLAITLLLVTLSALHLTAALKGHGRTKHQNKYNHSHPSITTRQHQQPRNLLDVCAYIDASLLGQQSILGFSLGALLDIDICLCLSALPLYLETNAKIRTIVDLFGLDEVSALLEALINESPTSQKCSFPAHSKASCTKGNVCDFDCLTPYYREGLYCVCQAPHTTCNGECGYFPHGCASPVPRGLRESGNSRVHGTRSVDIYSRIKGFCKPEEEVCGTYGGRESYECLDVKSSLESCGGCAIPNPFLPEDDQVRGVDCSALPGVEEVTCSFGACVVRRCKYGWALNQRSDACQRIIVGSALGDATQRVITSRSWEKMKKVKIPIGSEDSGPGPNHRQDPGRQAESVPELGIDLSNIVSLDSELEADLIPMQST